MFTFREKCVILFVVIIMPVVSVKNKDDMKKYESFVEENDFGNIMQSIEWSKLKQDWEHEVVFLYNENTDEIIGSALVLLRKIPIINSYIAYIPRGPILIQYNKKNMKRMVDEILLLKEKYNIFLIRFDPRIESSKELQNEFKGIFKIRGENFSTKRNINPRLNMIIDLNSKETIEEIFKTFSKSTKLNIKKAKRLGCVVEDVTGEVGLKEFYSLHEVTGKRDNFIVRPYQYFETMYKLFGKDGKFKILRVKCDGKVFGSIILLSSGNTMWYYAGASSNFQGKYKANYLLQMYAMNLSKEMGYRFYDMGGVYSEDYKVDPLYIFKHGFCRATTHFIGELDYPCNKFKYLLYNLFEILRGISSCIKNKIKKLTYKNKHMHKDIEQLEDYSFNSK